MDVLYYLCLHHGHSITPQSLYTCVHIDLVVSIGLLYQNIKGNKRARSPHTSAVKYVSYWKTHYNIILITSIHLYDIQVLQSEGIFLNYVYYYQCTRNPLV